MPFECLKTILIAIVEGITEWLPVSSTGHMILLENLFPITAMSEAFYAMFLYVIQFAAILAVIFHFFTRLNPFSRKKTEAEKKNTWHMWVMVLVGVLPAGVIGILFDDWVEENVISSDIGVFVIAAALILYGIFYVVLEHFHRSDTSDRVVLPEDLTMRDALYIGLFQCLSIIPGTSRSGSTILGARLLGVSRVAAAEYSFFMAIPIMAGVSLLKIGKFALKAVDNAPGYTCSTEELLLLLVGSVVAFFVSLFCIRFLVDFVRRHSFACFGWYRIILGIVVILYFSFV